MGQYAAYEQSLVGTPYGQGDELPVMTRNAQAWAQRSGRAVDEPAVVATEDIVVAGVEYSAGDSLAGLSPAVLRRLLRKGLASGGEVGPPPDVTGPDPGVLESSEITESSFTLTVAGASDEVGLHAEPYSFTVGDGDPSPWQSSAEFVVTDLEASTDYDCSHEVRDSSLNVSAGEPIVVTTSTPSPSVQVIESKRFWTGASVPAGPAVLALEATPEPGDVIVVAYYCLRQSSYRVISSINGAGATWAASAANQVWIGTNPTTAGNITITQNAAAPMDAMFFLVRGLPAAAVDVLFGAGALSRNAKANEFVVAVNMIVNNNVNQPSWPDPRTPADGWVDIPLKWDPVYMGGTRFAYRIPTEETDTVHTLTSGSPVGGASTAALATIG